MRALRAARSAPACVRQDFVPASCRPRQTYPNNPTKSGYLAQTRANLKRPPRLLSSPNLPITAGSSQQSAPPPRPTKSKTSSDDTSRAGPPARNNVEGGWSGSAVRSNGRRKPSTDRRGGGPQYRPKSELANVVSSDLATDLAQYQRDGKTGGQWHRSRLFGRPQPPG